MANGENRQKKNELIANEWTTVRSLWDACKGNVTDSKVREEIEGLLSKERKWSSEAEDWYALNLAKQQVGAHLSPIQVDAEFQGLLDVARDRSVPCLARFQELKASLFSKPTPEGVTSDQQRAAYLSLLQKLQSDFVETRFQRQLRREAATRLFHYGVIVFCLALVPLAVFLIILRWSGQPVTAEDHLLFSIEPAIGLMLVAAFGALGAYFSRVMSFQSRVPTVHFDDVMNLYHRRMLLLRLLYGSIAAIIFYFVMRSGLVTGTAFPNLSLISTAEDQGVTSGKFAPGGHTIFALVAELAKLLVWSFIAGFSERLIPDVLESEEAQAKK